MHDATISISGAIKTLLIWLTPALWNDLEGDSLFFVCHFDDSSKCIDGSIDLFGRFFGMSSCDKRRLVTEPEC